jgi:hypothetical protein
MVFSKACGEEHVSRTPRRQRESDRQQEELTDASEWSRL